MSCVDKPLAFDGPPEGQENWLASLKAGHDTVLRSQHKLHGAIPRWRQAREMVRLRESWGELRKGHGSNTPRDWLMETGGETAANKQAAWRNGSGTGWPQAVCVGRYWYPTPRNLLEFRDRLSDRGPCVRDLSSLVHGPAVWTTTPVFC